MIETGLKGKVALVTGANNPHGIGAATARALASQGAAVFITYLRSPEGPPPSDPTQAESPGEAFYRVQQALPADAVLKTIRRLGGRAESREVDLARVASISELFDQIKQVFGPVDVLVNNAAYCLPDTFLPASRLPSDSRAVDGFPLQPITAKSFDRHVAVNSRAVALMMAEYARRHLARAATWGRIINVSTDGAYCFPSEVSYGASKHALESLSRSAAAELGQFGITVNVVSLGPIQTGSITPEQEREIAARNPSRRVGHPKDVADVIVFLASQQARWVTGQLIHVGGGHAM